jgi:CubicO group peptidase (beta-lactamase class C family)
LKTEDPIASALGQLIDDGQLAGAVTLVWKGGEVIQAAALGQRDLEAGLPVERDTLFRIASLTKPITSLAAMTLWEEGRFALDEPITRWAPEFAQMRVLRSPNDPLHLTDPAERPITFEDLLTHRSGLTYGDWHTGPLKEGYSEQLGGSIDSWVEPEHWIGRLGALPLIDQPGADFHYGSSTDFLGLLLARMEDAPLGEVLERRIFAPLGMKDTGFTVPEAKWDRRMGSMGFDRDGRLKQLAMPPGGAVVKERPVHMNFTSGGQGLWSTADDYLAFARVFAEDGTVDGVQVVKPQTVALMRTNRLTERQRLDAKMIGMSVFGQGSGFGLGVAVTLDPETAPFIRGKGGAGTVGWPGAYGGWWQADPTDRSVMILLTHNMVDLPQIAKGYGIGAFYAAAQVHAVGSEMKR